MRAAHASHLCRDPRSFDRARRSTDPFANAREHRNPTAPRNWGVSLNIQTISGEELIATGGEEWQDYILEQGLTDSDLRLAIATPPEGTGLAFQMIAWRIKGEVWGPSLAAFIQFMETASDGSFQFEPIHLAGRTVLRGVLTTDTSVPPSYYYPVGDTLFFFQTPDVEAAENALSQLPVSGEAAAAQNAPGGQSPPYESVEEGVFTVYIDIGQPACVGYDESLVVLVRIDPPGPSGPVPASAYSLDISASLGQLVPVVSMQQTGRETLREFIYKAPRPGEETITAIARFEKARLIGSDRESFRAAHCLNGLWHDPDNSRTLQVNHQRGGSLDATIVSGELCGRSQGSVFSGQLVAGNQVDLLLDVCNPQDCVDASLLPQFTTSQFHGTVSEDGSRIEGKWTNVNYDGQWDAVGNLIACFPADQELVPLSFTRKSFGPEAP